MRKDQKGRPPKNDIRQKIERLRDENYSYTEIAQKLGMKSRQAARHYMVYKPKIV